MFDCFKKDKERANKMTKQHRDKMAVSKKKRGKKKSVATDQNMEDYRRLKYKLKLMKNILMACIVLVCIFFLITLKTHRVSGVSMAPTFANKDRIVVTKGKTPSRLDIVTFSPKDKPKDSYVKRVVGLPGDTIWLEENKLFINHQIKEGTKAPVSNTDKRAIDLPDGTIKINVSVDVMNQLAGLTKIPKNHYFLLGDNRNHSTDSRMMGLIEENQIEGVVSFRYYPLNKFGFVR